MDILALIFAVILGAGVGRFANIMLGIIGAAWATNADFGVAALLNIYFVYRYVGFGIGVKDVLKIVAATAVMGGAVLLSYDLIMLKTMHNTLATLVSIAIGGTVYFEVRSAASAN